MEEFFGKSYIHFYSDFMDNETTKIETTFIKEETKGTGPILDICCAHGRHTIELNKNMIETFGIDINKEALEIAQENAIAQNLPKNIFMNQNLFTMKIAQKYNCIIAMCNTLGLFLNNDVQLLRKVKSLLNKDGIFIFDVINRNFVSDNYKSRKWIKKNNDLLLIEYLYDSEEKNLNMYEIRIINEIRTEHKCKVHLYDLEEIEEKLRANGLKLKSTYANYKRNSVDNTKPELVLVAQKY